MTATSGRELSASVHKVTDTSFFIATVVCVTVISIVVVVVTVGVVIVVVVKADHVRIGLHIYVVLSCLY